MDWRVTADITSEPVELEVVKGYIRSQTGVTAEDTILNTMIKTARQKCEEYKGVAVAEKTISLTVCGDDIIDSRFVIPVYPVISVESITPYDNTGAAGTALTQGTDYYEYGVQNREVEILEKWFTVGVGAEDIVQYIIVFKAGYGDDDTEELPEGFKMAIYKQVASWYINREDYLPVLSSEVKDMLDELFGINVWL